MRGRARTTNVPFLAPGDVDDRTCPACGKNTFKSSQGLMNHMSSARSCQWYRKGKNPARLSDVSEVAVFSDPFENGESYDMDDVDSNQEPQDIEDIWERRDLFTFSLPPDQADSRVSREGEASSSTLRSSPVPSRFYPALDDDQDERVEEVHPLAGRVIRMEPTIVETWKSFFGDSGGGEGGTSVTQEDDQMDVDGDDQIRRSVNPDAKWKPFASEMDWRVAKWFIHEDIGQNALDRFLSIPGVS